VRGEVALAELRPHLGHDLHVGLQLLQMCDEVLGHAVAVLVVGPRDGVPLEGLLGQQDGGRAAFDEGVRGRAKDVPVPLVLGQRRGLGDRDEEQRLVLLGDLGDGERHATVNDAGQEVDLLLEDEIARLANAHVGLGLIVADDELELPPEDPARRIDLLDGHLVAGDGGLGVRRGGAAEPVDDTDLDGLLRGRRRGGRERAECDQGNSGQDRGPLHRASFGRHRPRRGKVALDLRVSRRD